MKALVTGGGGFLGERLVELLSDRGDEVVALGRNHYPSLDRLGVRVVRSDIGDELKVADACKGCDVVFHVASKVESWGAANDFYRTNVLGTRNVLAACRTASVFRLVYTSSPSVVFDPRRSNEGIDERVPYARRFLSHYARTKAQAERELLSQDHASTVAVCAIRPHLLIGPGDRHIIPRILAAAREGRLRQVGDGSNRVDFTYVDDAARAHIAAADALEPGSPVAGRTYFVSQGQPVLLWETVRQLLSRLGLPPIRGSISYRTAYGVGSALEFAYKTFPFKGGPPLTRWLAAHLAKPHWFDISAARRDFGYAPQVSLETALETIRP